MSPCFKLEPTAISLQSNCRFDYRGLSKQFYISISNDLYNMLWRLILGFCRECFQLMTRPHAACVRSYYTMSMHPENFRKFS